MQHLGIIAVLVLLVVGLFIILKWPPRRDKTFSEHVALRRSSSLLFGFTLGVATILYYAFLVFWLGPYLDMTTPYYLLLIIAFISQLVVAVVPASTGRAMIMHTRAAFIVAFAMLFLAPVILLTASSLSLLSIIFGIAFTLYGLILIYLYLYVPKVRETYLNYQISYFVAFWLMIATLTYA